MNGLKKNSIQTYRFIFPILAALLAGPVVAQKSSLGYIITLSGDSLRGFIKEGTDLDLQKSITFQSGAREGAEKQYAPSQLREVHFDYGRRFVRKSFLASGTDSTVVLAKEILIGKINLYAHERKKGEPDFFLVNNSSKVGVHLTEPAKEIMTADNGLRYEFISPEFMRLIQLVKEDGPVQTMSKMRYSDGSITKNILRYNNKFSSEFPVRRYEALKKHTLTITAGQSLGSADWRGNDFRGAAYISWSRPEKSKNWSVLMAVTYWRGESGQFRDHWVSVIPLGISIQTGWKIVQPYLYLGLGLGYYKEEDLYYADDKKATRIYPAVLAGGGLKIKTGPVYVVAEITPSAVILPIHLVANVGLSLPIFGN